MQPDAHAAPSTKPLPSGDDLTRPFWDACARHTLDIQQCASCNRFIHFPLPACPACGSQELGWSEVSGRGTIYSYVVVHQAVTPGFEDDVPYVVAWVELEEQQGLRLLCNILGSDPDEVHVGDQVEVCFEVRGEYTMPQFRLRTTGVGAST